MALDHLSGDVNSKTTVGGTKQSAEQLTAIRHLHKKPGYNSLWQQYLVGPSLTR